MKVETMHKPYIITNHWEQNLPLQKSVCVCVCVGGGGVVGVRHVPPGPPLCRRPCLYISKQDKRIQKNLVYASKTFCSVRIVTTKQSGSI